MSPDDALRLYVVSDVDHRGIIVVVAALGIPCILIFGLIRIFVRRATEVGLDDLLLGLATGASLIQAGLLIRACASGLGRATGDVERDSLQAAQQVCLSPPPPVASSP